MRSPETVSQDLKVPGTMSGGLLIILSIFTLSSMSNSAGGGGWFEGWSNREMVIYRYVHIKHIERETRGGRMCAT